MRLGAVARAVIIASCFWMAGGTYFIAKAINDKATAKADAFYEQCPSAQKRNGHCSGMSAMIYQAESGSRSRGGVWGTAALQAISYLAVALAIFGAVYGSIRWVLAGRKAR